MVTSALPQPPRHSLEVPYPPRSNKHLDAAAARHIDWLTGHGMLGGQDAVDLYEAWGVEDLTARLFPETDEDGLTLAFDLFGFYFLFDDQFDGEVGIRPRLAAEVCQPLIEITHGDYTGAGRSPVTASFADLWQRLTRGMSPRWSARAAANWEWYLASHANEAAGRSLAAEQRAAGKRVVFPDRSSFMIVRHGASGAETVMDAIERINRIEVPPAAFHSPQLRLLRQLAGDIPGICNDVCSYAKELPRGDVYNMVAVVQHQQQCTLEEAYKIVLAECQWMIDQCWRLSRQVPALCRRLGLNEEETDAVVRYADGMGDWIRGYLDWEPSTPRYQLDGMLPVDRPNYLEDLLGA
ncbi:terpene synthase family protein [Phaeacidiphilus oryzae]|uniref:terpene synthase family protein n=1 Tax=Phaeacidiphilus oryzae TaxID=348818 RepID=UPI00056245AE|nr:terpene synthase family protein [Phaeacidiphilus oryzae]